MVQRDEINHFAVYLIPLFPLLTRDIKRKKERWVHMQCSKYKQCSGVMDVNHTGIVMANLKLSSG
jgi:hypothetical protein